MMVTPEGRIETEDQAIAYVENICQEVVEARLSCDVYVPDDPDTTAKLQAKAYQHWLMRYGQAVGTVVTLHKCRLISDQAYSQLTQKISNTLVSRVVGDASASVQPFRAM